MKALILENKVVDIAEKEFPVAPAMSWVDCDDTVKVGWFYINEELKESDLSDEELLSLTKESKITQMKLNRDLSLESPMVSVKANEYGTDNEVYFEFQTKSTGNSLTEPATIIFRALSYPSIKYSCNIIEGEDKRKGYVEITTPVAEDLSSHLQLRATTNIQYANDLEEEISSIEIGDYDSLEAALIALNNINIDF